MSIGLIFSFATITAFIIAGIQCLIRIFNKQNKKEKRNGLIHFNSNNSCSSTAKEKYQQKNERRITGAELSEYNSFLKELDEVAMKYHFKLRDLRIVN